MPRFRASLSSRPKLCEFACVRTREENQLTRERLEQESVRVLGIDEFRPRVFAPVSIATGVALANKLLAAFRMGETGDPALGCGQGEVEAKHRGPVVCVRPRMTAGMERHVVGPSASYSVVVGRIHRNPVKQSLDIKGRVIDGTEDLAFRFPPRRWPAEVVARTLLPFAQVEVTHQLRREVGPNGNRVPTGATPWLLEGRGTGGRIPGRSPPPEGRGQPPWWRASPLVYGRLADWSQSSNAHRRIIGVRRPEPSSQKEETGWRPTWSVPARSSQDVKRQRAPTHARHMATRSRHDMFGSLEPYLGGAPSFQS